MSKDVAEIMAEKGSLEREFIELMLIADEPIITADGLKQFMLSSIAHSLAVIADTLSNRAEQTEPQTGQPCDGCEYLKPYIEYKCTHNPCKFEDEPQTEEWTKEKHEAFYTFLWNAINPNEMEEHIAMFESKGEPQTERSE